MSWRGCRVLVTGGEGFIGSHLVGALAREGAQVRVLTYYNPFGRRGWLDAYEADVEIVQGDVRDAHRVLSVVLQRDVVFHLAALVGIPYSYEAPESYVATNVVGTLNVLNACRAADVTRMVHTSTSEVYGSACRVPIDETHPLQPQSPYSASKIGADMLAQSFFLTYGLPVAIVRPFNTYGPRQSMRAIIPTVLSQLYDGTDELRLGSLDPRRDFNYVEDTVRGFMAVAQCDQALGQVVNVGSGRDVSVGEVVNLLMAVVDRYPKITTDAQRVRPPNSEVQRLVCDHTRAWEWAGWRPQVSLEEGLRRTAEWVRENLPAQAKAYHI